MVSQAFKKGSKENETKRVRRKISLFDLLDLLRLYKKLRKKWILYQLLRKKYLKKKKMWKDITFDDKDITFLCIFLTFAQIDKARREKMNWRVNFI